jgi:peptidoglycan/LPS O-acetylase OafA/YrhL
MTDKPNLDLLRTLAVSFVLVDHLLLAKGIQQIGSWDVSRIGQFGVFVFFVHTSLVLMWSLERRPNTLDFYIRRAFRLYPLAILTILIAAFVHLPMGGSHGQYLRIGAWTWKALLLNCLLLQEGLPWAGIIYGVTWSLAPEMYMYVLLPCLFFYARTVRKVWPLLCIFALVCLVDYRIPGAPGNHFAVLVPDFLAGIVAYVGFMRRKPVLPWWTLLPILAVLFVGYMHVHHWRSDWLACVLLGLVLPSIKQMQWLPLRRVSHTIATYSYGVYLLHLMAIAIGIYYLWRLPTIVQIPLVLAMTAVGAFAAYHLIERPLITFGAKVAARLAQERGLPSARTLEDLEPAP